MRIILVFFFIPHIRLAVIRTTHRQTRTHTHETFGSTNKLKLKFRNVRKNARVSLATFVAETIGRHRTQLTLLAAAATARKLQQFAVIAASTHATWSTLTHRGRRSVIVCVNRKLIAAKVASLFVYFWLEPYQLTASPTETTASIGRVAARRADTPQNECR